MNTSVRKVLLSPDHSIFAYNTEREGMEYGDLHLKDLDNRGRVKEKHCKGRTPGNIFFLVY